MNRHISLNIVTDVDIVVAPIIYKIDDALIELASFNRQFWFVTMFSVNLQLWYEMKITNCTHIWQTESKIKSF